MTLSFAKPFDCVRNHCGIVIDGAYPNLVVGVVDGVASASQSEALFNDARKAGLWKFLPAGNAAFAMRIQPISISVADGTSITVVESREEMNTSPVTVGEMVRFSPHRGAYDKPHPTDPYWFTFGCVSVLCGSQNHACTRGFRSGIYRVSDGAELDRAGTNVVSGGAVIDVVSMRVKQIGH